MICGHENLTVFPAEVWSIEFGSPYFRWEMLCTHCGEHTGLPRTWDLRVGMRWYSLEARRWR